jgi:hypothetical protein
MFDRDLARRRGDMRAAREAGKEIGAAAGIVL